MNGLGGVKGVSKEWMKLWGPVGTCSPHVFIGLSILGYERFESGGGKRRSH